MRILWQDLRYGFRVLRQSPGFALISVFVLAIAIGFNTATYSMADALVYRPLLVPDLDRVIEIFTGPKGESANQSHSPADYAEWRMEGRTVNYLSAMVYQKLNLTGVGQPEAFDAAAVTRNVFDALEAKPQLGRTFLPEETVKGGPHVVILSDAVWQNQFSRDPGVLNRTIKLEGMDYQVVGVMPRDFRYPPTAQMWIPLALDGREADHANFYLSVIGRLKPGVSLRQANAEFAMLAERSERKYPDSHANRRAQVVLLRDFISGGLSSSYMRMMIGAVLFVLLIACANVANLQFARMSARTHEIAVRCAVGAGRMRMLRQFLTESVLTALLGALLGILLTSWYLDMLVASMPSEILKYLPGWSRIGVNMHVLIYAVAASIASGLLAGIVPAWFASRSDVIGALKEESHGISSGKSRHQVRSILVVSEIVLTMVLVIGAGLMINGIQKVREPNTNIHSEQVLMMRVDLPVARYAGPEQWRRFEQQLLQALDALPGVQSTALVTALPYRDYWYGSSLTVEGPEPKPGSEPYAIRQSVSAGYFRELRIPLKQGRFLDKRDGENAPQVAVISNNAAQRYFRGENPIGKRIKYGPFDSPMSWMTIVGVAGDIRQDPSQLGLEPVVYRPFAQSPTPSAYFLARTAGDPHMLMTAVRTEMSRIDSEQPVSELTSYDKKIHEGLAPYNYAAESMGGLGIIALLLSSVGVYGIMAYSVSERRREISLRMALGASNRQVIWMVAKWGMHLTLSGVAIGITASLVLAYMLQRLVIGSGAYDPLSFAGGTLLLAAASMLACYVPLRRAIKIEPMTALKAE